jgi:hypothetical protein
MVVVAGGGATAGCLWCFFLCLLTVRSAYTKPLFNWCAGADGYADETELLWCLGRVGGAQPRVSVGDNVLLSEILYFVLLRLPTTFEETLDLRGGGRELVDVNLKYSIGLELVRWDEACRTKQKTKEHAPRVSKTNTRKKNGNYRKLNTHFHAQKRIELNLKICKKKTKLFFVWSVIINTPNYVIKKQT